MIKVGEYNHLKISREVDFGLYLDGVKQLYFVDPDGYWIEINNDYPKNTK